MYNNYCLFRALKLGTASVYKNSYLLSIYFPEIKTTFILDRSEIDAMMKDVTAYLSLCE